MSDPYLRIVDILMSDKTRLDELAELAGYDPETFYRGCNLSGVDLRGQDLRNMSFVGASLVGAFIDHETMFSHETTESTPLAFNYMAIGLEAAQQSTNKDLVYELIDHLATSVGLPRRMKLPLLKETSPPTVYAEQLRLRIVRCVERLDDRASSSVAEAKLRVCRTKKILLDAWELVAFFNALAGQRIVMEPLGMDDFMSWRTRRFMVEPPPKKNDVFRQHELYRPPPTGYIQGSGGRIWFLQLEVLVLALYFHHKRSISEDTLDAVFRAYYASLSEAFAGELPERRGKAALF
ncbi:MAG: hypothetical protein EOP84_00355 [Verrucomicrobiaceae bacterium]|nr:MAG: hypothetical protein EOP84_00355 [Verrucomicrobiaceae bacterium]